jgi:hypothetical protein
MAMLPVAVSFGTYDRLLKLPYTWYGPELPWVRFRGRPLPEWAVLVVALPVLWPVIDTAIMVAASTHLTDRMFDGVGWGVAHIAATWFVASWVAGLCYRHLINTDRDAGWIVHTVWSETVRVVAAYGPLDMWAVAATGPLWALATWALATTDLPLPVDLVAAGLATWPFGCWAVAAFQPAARAESFAVARGLRRGPNATVTLSGRNHAQA